MEARNPFKASVRGLFKKNKNREKLAEANGSSSTTAPSKADTQVTEPFPAGVRDWVVCPDADIDICFIHGLTGNRESSWTAEGHTEPWPQKLIPLALPDLKARIFTYGYDAYFVRYGHASSNQLTDHATNFLQKITADRESNHASDRPLIIVAHSLGGLVSKRAILESKDSPEPHLRDLYNNTIGIMFMGTPHTGAWLANWAKIPVDIFGILKSTNTTLLRVLQTSDELLQSLNKDFLYLLRTLREGPKDGKKIKVICFFEELGYPKIGHIVSKESATFASDPPISIHANHRNIIRFATQRDDGFPNVIAELRRWTNELRSEAIPIIQPDRVKIILQLVGLPDSERARTAMKFFLKSLGFGPELNLLSVVVSTDRKVIQKSKDMERNIIEAYHAVVARCCKSIVFEDMMVREETIARPEEDTCQWIYENPQYNRWISNEKPLLWIKGNPGSGKSILMKSLLRRRQSLGSSSTVLLRFFFNARGSDIEKSPEALYRTLLHGLISEDSLLLCEVLAIYLEKEARSRNVRWQIMELADIFHEKLEQFQSTDIEILIDALDECSDAEVLQVVRRFEKSVQAPRNGTVLRVCWSSRFYPHISLRTAQGIELVVNENNSDDIREYIQKVFPMSAHEGLHAVGEDIISRAKGIFLWASLVANKLIKAFDAGKDVDQLKAILHVIPDGLDNYFLEIFKEPVFTAEQREDLERIAFFVLAACRPFSAEELYTALLLENSSVNQSSHDFTLRPENFLQFKKRLSHASGGLIEVVFVNETHVGHNRDDSIIRPFPDDTSSLFPMSDPVTRVQVIHESVREFFLGKGLPVLQVTSRQSFLIRCHSGIVRAGFNGLKQIGANLDATKLHQGNEQFSAFDRTLSSLIPREGWRPSLISSLVEYIRDHIFTHFDLVRSAPVDDDVIASSSSATTACEEILHGYLRIGCFDAISYGGCSKSMNQQLRIVSKYAEDFGFDMDTFASLLDFPNRFMACSEFLERRGIYLQKTVSMNTPQVEDMQRCMAVFTEGIKIPVADPSQETDTDFTIFMLDPTYGKDGSASMVGLDPENESLLFGISFFVPVPMVGRLALPNRLSSQDYHAMNQQDVVLPVTISSWHIVSTIDPDIGSLLHDDLNSRPQGQLTLSAPSALTCRLFVWVSAEAPSSASKEKPVFVQGGTCSMSWQEVPRAPDRETVFIPWQEAPNST